MNIIDPTQFKNFTKSFRGVRFGSDGCTFLPQKGRLVLDLSSKDYSCDCTLRFVKKSGNGKVSVSTLVNNLEIDLLTKTSHSFDINIGNNKVIEISRPIDSIGEVILEEIVFKSDTIEEKRVPANWKSIIDKCGKYSCLRLIDNNLFASSGGFIEKGDYISSIETNPPNSFRRNGSKIVFINNCEILSLNISDHQVFSNKNIFVERSPAKEVFTPESKEERPILKSKATEGIKYIPQKITDSTLNELSSLSSNIVFDTNIVDLNKSLPVKNKYFKIVNNLGKKLLVVKQNASIAISVASLLPNKEYICVICAKSISGNGKIKLGIFSGENYNGNDYFLNFNNNFSNKYIILSSNNSEGQKLHLMRNSDSCTGELLINRIILLENTELNNSKNIKEKINNNYTPEYKIDKKSIIFNNIWNPKSNDSCYDSARKNARYYTCQEDKGITLDLSIKITNFRFSSWINKIKSFTSNLEVLNDSNITFTDLESLETNNVIWLDSFQSIDDHHIDKLSNCKIILSPSNYNCKYLQDKLKCEVIYYPKPLPFPTLKEIDLFRNINYVVAFNRDKKITSFVLENWSNDLPPLVLLGVRGNYPSFVIPTNEYLEYGQLAYILYNSNFIIDLNFLDNYTSSFHKLINCMGNTLITNNKESWKYNNTKIISLSGKNKLPDKDKFNNLIKLPNNKNKNTYNIIDYNNEEFNRLKILETLGKSV